MLFLWYKVYQISNFILYHFKFANYANVLISDGSGRYLWEALAFRSLVSNSTILWVAWNVLLSSAERDVNDKVGERAMDYKALEYAFVGTTLNLCAWVTFLDKGSTVILKLTQHLLIQYHFLLFEVAAVWKQQIENSISKSILLFKQPLLSNTIIIFYWNIFIYKYMCLY